MKQYITSDSLNKDSFLLASKVVESGFRPDFMVAIWRGGATIGCCMHEFFKYLNFPTDHIAIRTSRYSGIDKTLVSVAVHNLGYLTERLTKTSTVLLVDDVFDSGLSIKAIFDALKEKLGENMPDDIRVATVYDKPSRHKTSRSPDYYVHESTAWLVFPHELEALSITEIKESKGEDVANIVEKTMLMLAERQTR